LTELHQMQRRPAIRVDHHQVVTLAGAAFRGTWDEIREQLKAAEPGTGDGSMEAFMAGWVQRGKEETGVVIPITDAEAFIRGSAEAGVVRIVS
jgi:hypothetical protein